MQEIHIIIDRNVIEEYYKEYFFLYPKRKVRKIHSPIPPSLNELLTANRHAGNSIKHAWGELGEWMIKKNNLQDMNIKKCFIAVDYTFPTRKLRDLDNASLKGYFDSFVSTHFLSDDNFFVIQSLSFTGIYEKGVAKTVITVRYEEEQNNNESKNI